MKQTLDKINLLFRTLYKEMLEIICLLKINWLAYCLFKEISNLSDFQLWISFAY